VPKHQIQMKTVGDVEVPYKVPAAFDGLRRDDTVVMLMGGSGDRFAFALARNGQPLGATVMRVPAFNLSDDGHETDGHHVRLVDLYRSTPHAFHRVSRRDMKVMVARELYIRRMDAMRARIGCEQRLRQRMIGRVFFTEEGGYPEGRIEDEFDKVKANDVELANNLAEEKRCNAVLEKAVEELDVYNEVLSQVTGCGVSIASGLVAGIGSVSRFLRSEELAELIGNRRTIQQLDAKSGRRNYTDRIANVTGENHFQRTARIRQLMLADGKLDEAAMLAETLNLMQRNSDIRRKGANRFKKFCGVHLINGWALCSDCGHTFDLEKSGLADGCPKCHGLNLTAKSIFPRRRTGTVANWHPAVRQALYLLGDQFNRRKDSVWGKRLREIKAGLHQTHPEPVLFGKVKRFTPIHLHKTALWRTLTRFAEWLFNAWLDVELKAAQKEVIEVE
jgi:predicted Zn-ribbon and HTH transcriptional regulator